MSEETKMNLASAAKKMAFVAVMIVAMAIAAVLLNTVMHFAGGYKECMHWMSFGLTLSIWYDVLRLNSRHGIV